MQELLVKFQGQRRAVSKIKNGQNAVFFTKNT